jgi:hypothetical protein
LFINFDIMNFDVSGWYANVRNNRKCSAKTKVLVIWNRKFLDSDLVSVSVMVSVEILFFLYYGFGHSILKIKITWGLRT